MAGPGLEPDQTRPRRPWNLLRERRPPSLPPNGRWVGARREDALLRHDTGVQPWRRPIPAAVSAGRRAMRSAWTSSPSRLERNPKTGAEVAAINVRCLDDADGLPPH